MTRLSPRLAGGGLVPGLLLAVAFAASLAAGASPGEPTCPPEAVRVSVSEQRFAISACDAAVHDAVVALADAAGLRLIVARPIAGQVTLDVRDLPLRGAIRHLLRHHSFVLLENGMPASKPLDDTRQPPDTLWVISRPGDASNPATQPAVDDAYTRLAGARQAARKPATDAALATLRAALADDSARVRAKAVRTLARLGSGPATATLAGVLLDGSAHVRVEAALALGSIGTVAAAVWVESALLDPAPAVREAAVRALADMPGDVGIGALSRALQSGDPLMRQNVVEALEGHASDAAIAALGTAIDDPDPGVAAAAWTALSASDTRTISESR